MKYITKHIKYILYIYEIYKIYNVLYGIYNYFIYIVILASKVGQWVKNLPAMQEAQVQSLEDPLEEGMATHSSILAWRIPWTEEPGRL